MKNLLYLFIGCMVLFALGCSKDNDHLLENYDSEISIEDRGAKVTLCHITGNGSFHAINVNANAVPAHLGHGDGYPDACYDTGQYMDANCVLIDVSAVFDGCDGIDNDCDGEIDEGEAEICGDGIDNNCDGNVDEGCVPPCSTCPFCDYLESLDLSNACATECCGGYLVIYSEGQSGSVCCGVAINLDGQWATGQGGIGGGTISASQAAMCWDFLEDFMDTNEVPACNFAQAPDSENNFVYKIGSSNN